MIIGRVWERSSDVPSVMYLYDVSRNLRYTLDLEVCAQRKTCNPDACLADDAVSLVSAVQHQRQK